MTLKICCVQPFFRQTTKQSTVYVHLFGDKHLTNLNCQAMLSQYPKFWLAGDEYRMYTEYGLQKEIQKLLLKRKILSELPFSSIVYYRY